MEREALPAEVQVTVAVLGHQGLILLVEWNHFIFPFLNEKPVYIGLVWPVFLVCGEFFSQAILGPRNAELKTFRFHTKRWQAPQVLDGFSMGYVVILFTVKWNGKNTSLNLKKNPGDLAGY